MIRLTELALKKEGNCYVVATWLCHVISLVITSNNTPLSLPIALTYCLVSDGSPFRYTKPHLSIIGNWLLTLHCWESPPAAISFIEKPTSCYLIYWKALPLSFYYNFDIYSPTSHLLGYDFPWFNSVEIWITSYNLTTASSWRIHLSIPKPGRLHMVWQGSMLNPHKALGLWNYHAGDDSTAC